MRAPASQALPPICLSLHPSTYGLVDVGCTKCPEHSVTNGTGATGQDWCLVEAGYGWEDGQVLECDYGTWNEGGNRRPCTSCGEFFNTTNAPWSYAGERGSDSPDDCKIDFGYSRGVCPAVAASQGIVACLRGYYKNVVSSTHSCTQCPTGTSTTMARAAVAKSDCNTCRPGFGVTGGAISPSAPACTACGSGTFSSGYVAGGQPCKDCPKAANFTGKMVSPAGIFTPEDCYGEFTTDGEPTTTIMQNNLAWDYIPHSPGMLQLKSGATTPLACQADCSSSAVCQARIVRRHTLGRAMV